MSETEPQVETPAETEAGPAKETDWKAEARKWETRAKENLGRATQNEEAAKRLADLEEANKTEAQKVADRLAAAEKRAAELEVKAARAEVAAAKGVPVELLSGSTRDELEAAADALIKFKGDSSTRLHVPVEGKAPTAGGGSTADVFAAWSEDNFQNL